ncbi:hypothetical protein GCM10007203_24540 [Staphylococcus nepalensis]|nr:hypothetical protein GCM10007203_24540 [Staphylococcus nepalensis]
MKIIGTIKNIINDRTYIIISTFFLMTVNKPISVEVITTKIVDMTTKYNADGIELSIFTGVIKIMNISAINIKRLEITAITIF